VGELDNTPRPVAGLDTTNGGRLDAMMLDMKRTFDDVVIAHAPPDKAAAMLQNPFYDALSSSFSGTQEYMAMEKLGQLHAQAESDGRWDLIVVDTPPARSALDFLDAPEHLSNLLDGPFMRMLLAPARGPLRLMSVGIHVVTSAMTKILGGQILRDMRTFVTAFEALFGGFRQRAAQTHALLSSTSTTFLVLATAQRDALREAAYFVDRLTEEQMPLAGLVINRVHASQLEISAERALAIAEDLDPTTALAEIEALRRHASLERIIEQERLLLDRFTSTRPDVARTLVATLASDVTDLDALRRVGVLLADKD
jgi:anion-transporting  ArsA/GET3 family ATPase